MIGEPLGWSRAKYLGNIHLQDSFLEELNITTYNQFKDYLFYDVVQALTKVYMIRRAVKLVEMEEDSRIMTDEDIYRTDDSEKLENPNLLRKYTIDKELKFQMRLEFEFEHIDGERQAVLDVEEIKH